MTKNNISLLRFFIAAVMSSVLCVAPFSAVATETIGESVLASGKWVKVKVTDSGLYQITGRQLSDWGFPDISKVKVFGYGGAMISERLGEGYVDDLPQIPVYRNNNKLIFYAQGPISWKDSGSPYLRLTHTVNPYSLAGYYFITDRDDVDVVEPVSTGIAGNDAGRPAITSTLEPLVHDRDIYAPANTGRILLGEDFKYNSTQNFTFDLPGRIPGSDVRVRVNFMARVTSGGSSNIKVYSQGEQIETIALSGISGSDNYAIGTVGYCNGKISGGGEKVTVSLSYSNTGVLGFANLDYITLNYFRSLNMNSGSSFVFRSFSPNCTDSVFSISGARQDAVIWDITQSHNPKLVNAEFENGTLVFRQTEEGRKTYIAFDPSANFPTPVFDSSVKNQNLHGLETPTMVIISPKEFMQQAERIAELHRQMDGMKVVVVDDKEIYNEFSSGTPDAMAYRKLAKMWWDRTIDLPSSSNDKFRYMLLFGRSVFDNRKLTSEVRRVDYPLLLTWESYNSTSQSTSFNSDDVFGILDDNTDVSSYAGRLRVAIGRMPVKSVAEAKSVVDKLYKFVNNPDPGAWKNNVLIISDDGDSGLHMKDSDRTIEEMKANGGENYVYNRVYIDAFDKVSDGGGNGYPDAREKMLRLFKNGTIYASYLGHANPRSWTHNNLLRWEDIQNEFYYKHLPLLYTGTCEFTRWDDPDVSGGEELFLNANGGVIALFTSSRATGIAENGDLSTVIGQYLFRPDEYGEMRRIGDVLKDVKNVRTSNNSHNWKYALIGDPAMRLKYPRYKVVADEINGKDLNGDDLPELKALQTVTVKGHMENEEGEVLPVSGELYVNVYDSQTSVTTHGNHEDTTDSGLELTFDEWDNKLYNGVDSIKDGKFEFNFKVPREINDNYRPGLISMYAYSSENNIDGNGLTDKFYVYGYAEDADSDVTGPEIEYLYLNTDSFKDGDSVNETPYLLAKFRDESGINLSSAGVGHQITLVLDDKTTIYGLEPYYSQDADKNGYINFQMDELEEGYHTLRLRVWDTCGNASDKTISFVVVKGLKPELYQVYSDANPAKTEANFYLKHNRPDALITVTVSVYDLMGREVWTNTSTGRSDMYLSIPVTWDLTDGTGRRVGRGIYMYRASISTDGINEATKAQRIAVSGE